MKLFSWRSLAVTVLAAVGLWWGQGLWFSQEDSVLASSVKAKPNSHKRGSLSPRAPSSTLRPKPQKQSPHKISKQNSSREVWLKKTFSNLKEVERCYQTQKCGYPQTDPRSHDLAVARDLARRLDLLREQTTQWGLQDDSLRNVAIYYLNDSDGYVKEAALKILNSQNPSSSSLKAALNLAANTFDAALIKPLVTHFSKYSDPAQVSQIDQVLQESFKSGSVMVRRKISENISVLLNENNFHKYTQILSHLSRESVEYRYLSAALEEYRLKSSGG